MASFEVFNLNFDMPLQNIHWNFWWKKNYKKQHQIETKNIDKQVWKNIGKCPLCIYNWIEIIER